MLRGPECVAVGPVRRVRQPVDGRCRRLGAGVEHHALRRGEGRPACTCAFRGRRRPPGARPAHERDPGVDEPVHRDLVVPVGRRLVADPGVHGCPVGLDRARAGQVGDPPALLQRVGRSDHHLARDAAVVGALTPDQALVHPDDLQAGLRELGRQRLPARAESDHHHVHLLALLGHVASLPPVLQSRRDLRRDGRRLRPVHGPLLRAARRAVRRARRALRGAAGARRRLRSGSADRPARRAARRGRRRRGRPVRVVRGRRPCAVPRSRRTRGQGGGAAVRRRLLRRGAGPAGGALHGRPGRGPAGDGPGLPGPAAPSPRASGTTAAAPARSRRSGAPSTTSTRRPKASRSCPAPGRAISTSWPARPGSSTCARRPSP